MLGRYVSDLAEGDVFQPVDVVLPAAVVRALCHGFEESSEWFHGRGLSEYQYAPPTTVHTIKMRLLKKNCPHGDGPYPKLVVEYDAQHHHPIPVDQPLNAIGHVAGRYVKRERVYLHTAIALRSADNQLLVSYHDQMVIGYADQVSALDG